MQSQSGSRPSLKPKFIQCYEELFKRDAIIPKEDQFWADLLLLKVHVPYLQSILGQYDIQRIQAIKGVLITIVERCILCLEDLDIIRIANALQTLSVLFHGLKNKAYGDIETTFFDFLLDLTEGYDRMHNLVLTTKRILADRLEELPESIKSLAGTFLLVVALATPKYRHNEFIDILSDDEGCLSLFLNSVCSTRTFSDDSFLLITIVSNYYKERALETREKAGKKTESLTNPSETDDDTCSVHEIDNDLKENVLTELIEFDDEVVLSAIGATMRTKFDETFRHVQDCCNSNRKSSMLSSITSLVGNFFSNNDKPSPVFHFPYEDIAPFLLSMYELVYRNGAFTSILIQMDSPVAIDTPSLSSHASHTSLDSFSRISRVSNESNIDVSGLEKQEKSYSRNLQRNNLLGSFLSLMSILLHDVKDGDNFTYAMCGLNTLILCVKDQKTSNFIHGLPSHVHVCLQKRVNGHLIFESNDRPLACGFLDLAIECVSANMKRKFQFKLYMKTLGLIKELVCYQEKFRVRLVYPWKDLWNSLFRLLRFMVSNRSTFLPQTQNTDILPVCSQILDIFDLFITFGDTFLSDPETYDGFYYEIMREQEIFENLHSFASRKLKSSDEKTICQTVIDGLYNMRTIVAHFEPKLAAMQETSENAMTPQQVLSVIQNSYQDLQLKVNPAILILDDFNEVEQQKSVDVVIDVLVHKKNEKLDLAKFDLDTIQIFYQEKY